MGSGAAEQPIPPGHRRDGFEVIEAVLQGEHRRGDTEDSAGSAHRTRRVIGFDEHNDQVGDADIRAVAVTVEMLMRCVPAGSSSTSPSS